MHVLLLCVYMCKYFHVYICIYSTPLHEQVLNLEFFFSKTSYHTKNKVPSLPYYLPITGVGFILFSKGISAR